MPTHASNMQNVQNRTCSVSKATLMANERPLTAHTTLLSLACTVRDESDEFLRA